MKRHAPPEAPGQFFDLGGRRMHAVISGELKDKPAIVLEAGLTANSSAWHWVQEELSKQTRVLSYDRAGLGWSSSSSEPRHAENIAADLHRLLDLAKIPRPFVFAGHSMGAISARAYASLYPGEISAMAFVDAAHPDQMERSPQIKRAMRRFFLYLKTAPHLASCGATRIVGDFGVSSKACEGLPAIHKLATKHFFSSPRHMRASAREASEWNTSMAQVRGKTLGNLPLLVLTAPVHSMPGWMELQNELPHLSTNARHVIIEGSTHLSLLTNREFAWAACREIATLLFPQKDTARGDHANSAH